MRMPGRTLSSTLSIETGRRGTRHDALRSFNQAAASKHDQLMLTMTVAEANREIAQILEEQTRLGQILGITPRELRGIERAYSRHKLVRWAIKTMRPVLRRLIFG